jgi:hypothetical protein
VQNLYLVFNYGTFSFQTPFFYLKFVSGKLLYKLSFTSYYNFLYEYRRDKRIVKEEKLNLSLYQRQRIFDLLKWNYKPENREYQYDFFFDNCATRISGIFETALGDSLVYHIPQTHKMKTFRNLIDEYLTKNYWNKFGIDILLGAVIDKYTKEREITFLPDYMSEYANYCTINGEPFVSSSKILVKESGVISATPWVVRPKVVLWALFLLVTLLTLIFNHKSWIIGDKIIFGFYGVLGLIVFLMWVATDHDAAAENYNILWANPLYLVFVWLIGSEHKKALKWGAISIIAINSLVLIGWNIIPQQFNIAFIPFIAILIIRSGVIFLRNYKE